MRDVFGRKPTPGTVMGALALIVALGGTAIGYEGSAQNDRPGKNENARAVGKLSPVQLAKALPKAFRRMPDSGYLNLVAGFPDLASTIAQTPAGGTNFINRGATNMGNAGLMGVAQSASDPNPADVKREGVLNALNSFQTIFMDTLAAGSVQGSLLANDAVTADKIASNAVGSGAIQDGAVQSANLSSNSITTSKLAPGSVTSSILDTGAVNTINLAPGSVNSSILDTGAVNTINFAPGSVTSSILDTGAVNTINFAPGSVTSSILGTGAVTAPKMAASSVTSSSLDAGAVTAPKMAASSVTSSSLGAGAVTTSKFAPGSVTSTVLGSNVVTAAKMAFNAVTSTAVDLPTVDATHSSSQQMAGLTPGGPFGTLIAFNGENYDSHAFHHTSTNNHILTASVAGVYDVSARVVWEADAHGFRQLNLFKNGGDPVDFSAVSPAFDENGAPVKTVHDLNTQIKLEAGDTLWLRGRQSSAPCSPNLECLGHPLNIEAKPRFSMTWQAQG